jgi:hypothetical protein
MRAFGGTQVSDGGFASAALRGCNRRAPDAKPPKIGTGVLRVA